MTTRRIAVVSAGLGQPSATRLLADRLAAATVQALREQGVAAEVEVVELREHARALADNLVTGFPGGGLRAAVATVTGADALIAVTPVYAGSYSGLFKTFFDLLEEEALAGKPVLLAATAGTARHSLVIEHALRPLFSHLHAVAVPTGVFAAPEDWAGGGRTGPAPDRRDAPPEDWANGERTGPTDRRNAPPEDWTNGERTGPALDGRIARAAGQLADLVGFRRPDPPADPYADPVPFEQLLAGG